MKVEIPPLLGEIISDRARARGMELEDVVVTAVLRWLREDVPPSGSPEAIEEAAALLRRRNDVARELGLSAEQVQRDVGAAVDEVRAARRS